MKVNYTYQNYPNCPRATEYSKSAGISTAYCSTLVGIITLVGVFSFLGFTLSFFGSYNWVELFYAIAAAYAVMLSFFYLGVIKSNNTDCNIKIILMEDSNSGLPTEVVNNYCKNLKKENRKKNIETFVAVFLVFTLILFDAIALLAVIKGIYFLCTGEQGILLTMIGIVALGVFSCCVLRVLKKNKD